MFAGKGIQSVLWPSSFLFYSVSSLQRYPLPLEIPRVQKVRVGAVDGVATWTWKRSRLFFSFFFSTLVASKKLNLDPRLFPFPSFPFLSPLSPPSRIT
jgi:hypothetical protein